MFIILNLFILKYEDEMVLFIMLGLENRSIFWLYLCISHKEALCPLAILVAMHGVASRAAFQCCLGWGEEI